MERKIINIPDIEKSGNRELFTFDSIHYDFDIIGDDTGKFTVFVNLARDGVEEGEIKVQRGHEITLTEILEEIKKYDCRNVCIRGVEPMLQPNIFSLLQVLDKNRYKVAVDTMGSEHLRNYLGLRNVTFRVHYSRMPSAGSEGENCLEMISFLRAQDKIIFYLKSKDDFDYMIQVLMSKNFQGIVFVSFNGDQKLFDAFRNNMWVRRRIEMEPNKFRVLAGDIIFTDLVRMEKINDILGEEGKKIEKLGEVAGEELGMSLPLK
jgi:organic radical activating enzyme